MQPANKLQHVSTILNQLSIQQSRYEENQSEINPDVHEVDPEKELIEWWKNEVEWWSSLHNKRVDLDHASIILKELLETGYTVKDGIINCVHERLRRHRYDLSITCFYPDHLSDKEVLAALRRSYQKGYREGQKQTTETQTTVTMDHETKSLAKHIADQYERITELENQLLLERNRNAKT